jgi:hypothetical protein
VQQQKDIELLQEIADAAFLSDASARLTAEDVPSFLERLGFQTKELASASPYVVWVQNLSSVAIDIRIIWAQANFDSLQETGGTVSPNQVAPYILGGATGCGDPGTAVVAYVLQVYVGGDLVASTDVVYPSEDDGDICADAWGVSK